MRFFQYIDKADEAHLCKVTELAYIDDSDPDMILYIFTDGGRCNKDLIGPINAEDVAGKYFMVEVENRRNIWKIEKNVLKYEEKTITAANGEVYTIPDLNMTDSKGHFMSEGTRYNFIPPRKSDRPLLPELSEYYLSSIIEKLNNGEEVKQEILKNIPAHILPSSMPSAGNKTVEKEVVVEDRLAIKDAPTLIYVDEPVVDIQSPNIEITFNDLIFVFHAENNDFRTFDEVIIKDQNHNILWNGTATDDLVDKLTCKNIKESSDESKDNNDKDDIKLIPENPEKYKLVSDMINAANKDECDIDMSLVLKLPPESLYNVLKNVYGVEYTNMFVLNLANNLPMDLLRNAIATGLKNYYDPDSIKNEEQTENL